MLRRAPLACALALGLLQTTTAADTPRLEYRVVFATGRQLAAQLDSAGRDGYACVGVARPDPGVIAPGIAVVLGRIAGGSHPPVAHRVVAGGFMGTDLQAPLDRAGADGFRLCGVVLDEGTTPISLVAVLSQDPGATAPAHYGVEVLTNYKASLARLTAAGRDGFVPVAAAPVNNSRVPEMRAWLVVTERREGATSPQEIAVRSGAAPGALERSLNEQGKLGYHVNLTWQEGADVVAMMSRPAGDTKTPHAFTAESRSPDSLHSLAGLYLGDFPYLSGGDRLVVSDRSQPASTDVEEDPLPKPGSLGFADAGAMATIGDHISRHHGFAPAFVRIRRGGPGAFLITTVLSQPR
jgi:hypothetical protein